jgi:hypothetical protein
VQSDILRIEALPALPNSADAFLKLILEPAASSSNINRRLRVVDSPIKSFSMELLSIDPVNLLDFKAVQLPSLLISPVGCDFLNMLPGERNLFFEDPFEISV